MIPAEKFSALVARDNLHISRQDNEIGLSPAQHPGYFITRSGFVFGQDTGIWINSRPSRSVI